MFGHLPELLIVLVIGLIVFGPEKLPEVAGTVGKTVRELRQSIDSAIHPPAPEEDFSTYYYESLARAGEPVPTEFEEIESDDGGGEEGIGHSGPVAFPAGRIRSSEPVEARKDAPVQPGA